IITVCMFICRQYLVIILIFFFSSRRRHTRSKRDWSSDVCSSDLQMTLLCLYSLLLTLSCILDILSHYFESLLHLSFKLVELGWFQLNVWLLQKPLVRNQC